MNWLNLRTETLHAPEFIGSDPTARGTWIALMFYCAQQENGGVIVGAAAWSDRQWQQTCGVTRAEVDAAAKLTRWAGDDLHVFAYPIDQEAAFAAMSSGGRAGGLAKARNRLKQATAQGPLVAPLEPGALAKGREGNGKEGKEKADSAATSAEVLADRGGEAQLELVPEAAQQPAQPATPPVLTFPCYGKVAQWHLTDAFLAELRAAYPSIDPLAEAKVALLKVTVGAVTRKTAGGVTRFLCSWMDRATNGNRNNSQKNAPDTSRRRFANGNDYSATGL